MLIKRLWGVGPKTARRLRDGGVRTVRDLAVGNADAIQVLVGERSARHLQALAHGEDDRPVAPSRGAKSVSSERTYETDLADPDEIDREFLARSEQVARELRKDRLIARTVRIKVRTGDFTTWTRSTTLPEPTDLAETIVEAARKMFRTRINLRRKGVRLLGVGAANLASVETGQDPMFPDPDQVRARKRAKATDAIRDKLGEKAVTRARLIRKKKPPARGEEP